MDVRGNYGGGVEIGSKTWWGEDGDLTIGVDSENKYWIKCLSGKEVLKITNSDNINALTQESDGKSNF